MANKKNKINFLCSSCGDDFAKWNGQCPSCKEWGTLSEFKVLGNKNARTSKVDYRDYKALNDILESDPGTRITTSMTEADRVLGGGLLPGSLLLLGGSPGVGKSTLALHICAGVNKPILYVSAEESEEQVAIRAKRINVKHDNLHLSSENDLNGILMHIDRIAPAMVIIDSIQTIINPDLDSLPGSPSQIRDCGQKFLEVSKQNNVIIMIIGHVTKEGTIAGPKMLEHMVDTVLYLEGDDRYEHRILRAAKNRFGATNEVGIFHMNEDGLNEVSNPSEMFLSERSKNIPGTCIYPSLEGTRPILIEVQALVSTANFGTPQRNVNGFDLRRLSMLLAVLEKRMELVMGIKDVFINLVGGLKVDDPAADLSILCAIASSFMDKPIDETIVFVGEIGLAGEIRSISRLGHRLAEVSALGFSGAVVPSASMNGKLEKHNLKIYPVDTVRQAFDILF